MFESMDGMWTESYVSLSGCTYLPLPCPVIMPPLHTTLGGTRATQAELLTLNGSSQSFFNHNPHDPFHSKQTHKTLDNNETSLYRKFKQDGGCVSFAL